MCTAIQLIGFYMIGTLVLTVLTETSVLTEAATGGVLKKAVLKSSSLKFRKIRWKTSVLKCLF